MPLGPCNINTHHWRIYEAKQTLEIVGKFYEHAPYPGDEDNWIHNAERWEAEKEKHFLDLFLQKKKKNCK